MGWAGNPIIEWAGLGPWKGGLGPAAPSFILQEENDPTAIVGLCRRAKPIAALYLPDQVKVF